MPRKRFTVKVSTKRQPYAEKNLNAHLKKIGISRRNVRGMTGTQIKRRGA